MKTDRNKFQVPMNRTQDPLHSERHPASKNKKLQVWRWPEELKGYADPRCKIVSRHGMSTGALPVASAQVGGAPQSPQQKHNDGTASCAASPEPGADALQAGLRGMVR